MVVPTIWVALRIFEEIGGAGRGPAPPMGFADLTKGLTLCGEYLT